MTAAREAGQRGAALLTVLLLSALLASLAAVAARSSLSGARAAMIFLDAARADDLGRAAPDVVAFQIATGDRRWRRGGALAVHLAQADLEVEYRSESARIDVNKAPIPLISALLGAAGAEPAAVAAIAERIAAFRAAAGAAAGVPPIEAAPSRARHGSDGGGDAEGAPRPPTSSAPELQLQHTSEVVSAWGLPPDLARRVLPSLTVANGGPTVDPVLADRLVLSALLGDHTRVDDYLNRRDRGFIDTDAALLLLPKPAAAFAGFTDAPAVHALVRVTIARRFVRRYDIVMRPAENPSKPPTVISWRPVFGDM